jgi:hypothetical protein
VTGPRSRRHNHQRLRKSFQYGGTCRAEQQIRNQLPSLFGSLTISKIVSRTVPLTNSKQGDLMNGKAISGNVRRYRTIASLYRQTATFRPDQKWSLLAQAYEFERLAMTELESNFAAT